MVSADLSGRFQYSGVLEFAAYPQDAFLVVGDLAAVFIPERNFIAGHPQAGGAEFFSAPAGWRDRCAALPWSPALR